MYWFTEPNASFLREACGDWNNCRKRNMNKITRKCSDLQHGVANELCDSVCAYVCVSVFQVIITKI